jgi:hypothetical protein
MGKTRGHGSRRPGRGRGRGKGDDSDEEEYEPQRLGMDPWGELHRG